MPGSETFLQRERIKRQADFARVYARRSRASDDLLTVYVARNDLGWSRLGISVSRRAGSAVRRSYIRRRIREAFRRNKARLPSGLDIVCVTKAAAGEKKNDVSKSFVALACRAARRLSSPEDKSRSCAGGE